MELLVEAPGKWWFTEEAFNTKGELVDYKKVAVDQEAQSYMDLIVECMVEAQTYTFKKIYPNTIITGKAEASAAPYWLH